MPDPRRLTRGQLETVRGHFVEQGGILYRRLCPRELCQSSVIQYQESVVCLTCGWTHEGSSWGLDYREVNVNEARSGQPGEFRALRQRVKPLGWRRALLHAGSPSEPAESSLRLAASSSLRERMAASTRPVERTADRGLELSDEAPEVVIFTDGSCTPNPGPGGWAAILWTEGWEMEIAGGRPYTTSSRMELAAALHGLQALNRPCRVTVVTDSAYLAHGMIGRITGWSKRHWRRNGRLIPNADLWQQLAEISLDHQIFWAWTPAHNGQPENERCDRLASQMLTREDLDEPGVLHREHRARSGRLPRIRRHRTAEIWRERKE